MRTNACCARGVPRQTARHSSTHPCMRLLQGDACGRLLSHPSIPTNNKVASTLSRAHSTLAGTASTKHTAVHNKTRQAVNMPTTSTTNQPVTHCARKHQRNQTTTRPIHTAPLPQLPAHTHRCEELRWITISARCACFPASLTACMCLSLSPSSSTRSRSTLLARAGSRRGLARSEPRKVL